MGPKMRASAILDGLTCHSRIEQAHAASMNGGWLPLDDLIKISDGQWYLLGLFVCDKATKPHFEYHRLWLNDNGYLMDSNANIFTDWSIADFEYYQPDLPPPPATEK